MLLRTFAYTLIVTSCLTMPALAQDRDRPRPALKPRVEGNLRAGTERSIAMTEFWVPLAQDNAAGSVIYGDARFMGDDKENNEFNLGVGYRKIVTDIPVLGNGVAGVHGWIDRRHTERGATFNQITTGAEWHGESFDIKANAYIPLSDEKTHGVGTGTSAPYLAGSGIFYDINNFTVTEEAQPGFDLELGLNVSGIVDNFADSARIYAGAYHFNGDKTDNVTGWRTRVASDITQDFQIGARFQRDDERGSQGFLEATIRFPFGNKQSYRSQGLYARLDESPERDIDIVTGASKPVASGTNQSRIPILNANSGDAQRVLYVDNAAAGGGTGTKENPFNTLAAAQAALDHNDVVYVARGDGLTTGMQDGFTINRNNVTMIGAGSAFVFDGGKFTTPGANFTGMTLIGAGLAPQITNVNPVVGAAGTDSGNTTGNAITVTGSNAHISGFTLTGAQGSGLRAWYNGTTSDTLRISNITATGNQQYGMAIRVWNGGLLNNAIVDNVVIDANVNHGLYVTPQSGGDITNFIGTNITTSNNTGTGMQFLTFAATSFLDHVFLDRIKSFGNTTFGVQFRNGSGIMNNVTMQNSDIYSNQQAGVFLDDDTGGQNPNFDLGGGGRSIGYNRIYNNALGTPAHGDLRLDLDGSPTAAMVQYNWWGDINGLLPARVSQEGACPGSCGTHDADHALTSDPRP